MYKMNIIILFLNCLLDYKIPFLIRFYVTSFIFVLVCKRRVSVNLHDVKLFGNSDIEDSVIDILLIMVMVY